MGQLTHHACETGSMHHVCVLLSRISPIDCDFFTEDIFLVCKRHAVVNYFAIKSSTCAFLSYLRRVACFCRVFYQVNCVFFVKTHNWCVIVTQWLIILQ